MKKEKWFTIKFNTTDYEKILEIINSHYDIKIDELSVHELPE
jgi:hypothetical protein